MEEWQDRVIKEKKELGEKLEKLIFFINSPEVENLNYINKKLLKQQRLAMELYFVTLERRIEEF